MIVQQPYLKKTCCKCGATRLLVSQIDLRSHGVCEKCGSHQVRYHPSLGGPHYILSTVLRKWLKRFK